MKQRVNHKHEAEEAYDGRHFNATYTENIGFEGGLGGTGAGHQQESQDDNHHAHSEQDEVGFAQGKLIFVHRLHGAFFYLFFHNGNS
jgi:hypothetical protein